MTAVQALEWAVENKRTRCGSPAFASATADGWGTAEAVVHKERATREACDELTETPSPQYPLLYDYGSFKDSPTGEGVAW